jgi:hypothetical protein
MVEVVARLVTEMHGDFWSFAGVWYMFGADKKSRVNNPVGS